jgi:hypothetical protein
MFGGRSGKEASPDEIRQAIFLISGTAGFPAMMAALSWVEDIVGREAWPTARDTMPIQRDAGTARLA